MPEQTETIMQANSVDSSKCDASAGSKKRRGEGGGPVAGPDTPDAVPESPKTETLALTPKITTVERIFLVELLSDNSYVVEKALLTISEIIAEAGEEGFEEICFSALKLGAVALITGNMLKWKSDPDIQKLGCSAMQNILYSQPVEEHKNPNQFHAIKAIAQAMANYPKYCDLQRHACGAITNLCNNSKANAEYVVKQNGSLVFNLIIRAGKTFKDNQALQNNFALVISNLLCWDEVFHFVLCSPTHFNKVMEVTTNVLLTYTDERKEGVKELRERAETNLNTLLKALKTGSRN